MGAEILSNLVITKVHLASTMYSPKNARDKRYDRPRWAIILKYEGETTYTTPTGEKFPSDSRHVVVLPKGSCYEWHCTKEGHFFAVEFECEKSHPLPLLFTVSGGEKLIKAFRELEYKRNEKAPMMEIESIRDVYSILLAITKTVPEPYLPSDKQQKLAPAIEYISQNYNKTIRNDLLADISGLSTVYFRKLFTAAVGTSPITYARLLRIEKAKEMLRSDYGALSDLALSLGYQSLYDFSRDFKKHTGVSPSKYSSK